LLSFFINKLQIHNRLIKKLSILVFIWSSLVFFLNLQYDLLDDFDFIIFWLCILLMIGIVIFQIFFIKNNLFVLFEIVIIYFFLHLIFQIGFYGLRGTDSYVDYNLLKTILNNNNFVLGQDVNGWPMIHIFSSSLSFITKIDPILVAKFLPSFISSIIVLPFYLLVYNIYKHRKIALFSCLIFGTIPQFVSFESAFVRETYALFILVLFVYLLYIAKKRNDYRLTWLTMLLCPVIIFAHHFTSFMIIILLASYIIVSRFILYIYQKDINLKKRLSGIINIKMIFLVTAVSLVAYWAYHAVFIVEYSSDVLYEGLGLKEITTTYAQQLQLSAPIVTIRGNILYYGFFFFHLFFSVILMIKFFIRKNDQKIEDTAFTIFFYFCLFYAFLALFIIGSLLFPDRFLPFAWMFGIIPITGFLLILKKNYLKKILVTLLIVFVIFNVYNIDPELYTDKLSLQEDIATEKEYIIAEQFNFPDVYFGYSGVYGAIHDIQGIDPRYGGKNIEKIGKTFDYSTLAVINEEVYFKDLQNYKEKSKEGYEIVLRILSYKNDPGIDKICDLGNVYVIKGMV